MEALVRGRRPVRREFSTLLRQLNELLEETPLKPNAIHVKYKVLVDAYEKLQQLDAGVIEQFGKLVFLSPEDEDKEFEEIREHKERFETVRLLKEQLVPERMLSTESVTGVETKMRNFKLPALQVQKFSGEMEDWLTFWAQFKKIDEDPHMCGSDKFGYLFQSLQPGSEAYEIASVYPQSNENYPLLITALKKNFGNEDLLLQVYIRKLLNLVISNAHAQEKQPVKSLYLKLDSHLRALKTLNLEAADPATWLFPLVESCLPEQILDNWQRSPLSTHDGSKDDPPKTRLDSLMTFLEKEVEIRQRINISQKFANEQCKEQRSDQRKESKSVLYRKPEKRVSVPTLSSFQNAERTKCAFCGKGNHESKMCFRAKEMTYEERIEFLRGKRLCFRCCGTHFGKECRTDNLKCGICGRKHITLLCKEYKRKQESDFKQPPPKQSRIEIEKSKTNASNANVECSGEVALQTVLVKLVNGSNEKIVRAFIDSGSQRSYILKKTATKLGLQPIGLERVVHSLFGGKQTQPITHHKYTLDIKSLEREFEKRVEVRESEDLSGIIPQVAQGHPNVLRELRRKNLILSDEGAMQTEIEFLIGADVYPHIITNEIVKLSSGAVAIQTKLGWTLLGELSTSEPEEDMSALTISLATSDVNVTKLWELDVLGIRDPADEHAIKIKEELARENYLSSISRNPDGRYCVKLPWKEFLPNLPSNRMVAYKRLQSASRKLNDLGLYDAYDKVLGDWEIEGIVERIPENDDAYPVHYIPHRAIVKESLTTPVRPVFDASCRVGKSPSLNDCLYTGENCVKLIFEILQRFREKPVAFSADIKKAFLTISVDENERNFMRFLWWENKEMKKTIELRHARVMFGATCSPFILAVVLYQHLTSLHESENAIGIKLLESMYVDNCLGSEDTAEDYFKFREKSIEIFKRAQMDLRMWISNIDDVIEDDTRVTSVLGLMWNREEDTLYVNTKNFKMPEEVTKRSVLSTVQKVYDPIGFTSPCVLPMKALLQRTWINKMKWDEQLPAAECEQFTKWCKQISNLGDLCVPRLFSDGVSDRKNWTLVTFTDASKISYSAVVYLRVKPANKVSVQLLAAKSRLAPVKQMTIPKLELMGCLLGARLAASVKAALKLTDIVEIYFCDSTTAEAWITRDDQWGTFVGNRTREINKLTSFSKWRYVPGSFNPADLPSRGCMPTELLRSKWWEGPLWLLEDERNWPTGTRNYDEDLILAERKKTPATVPTISYTVLDRVRNACSFASRVRIVGWVRRFLFNKFENDITLRRHGELTKRETDRAELFLLRQIQREHFLKNEIEKLTGFEILEDEMGIMRVKTRLTFREDLAEYRYPVLLPNKSEEVKQLIRDMHKYHCHAGVGFLLTYLRKKYWIIKARKTIRGVIYNCEKCQRFSAKPVVPAPAPLPLDRVKDAELFEVVGTDLEGPLILKNGNKVWIVIFTCAIYRAVHFELVKKISTNAFINALEIFSEKYRRPAIIYSDNGTNFRGTCNLFKKIDWDAVESNENSKIEKIIFKFNPVHSSWWGGWWERLIRSAKDLLRRTVGKASVNYKELKAIIKTIGEVMNNRPLTYVSENPEDLEPLTPALFMHPFGNATLPEKELTESDRLRFRLKYVTTLRKELKGRFLKEYLSMLVNRNPKRATKSLEVGNMVFIGSDNHKRIEWPLGRVTEMITGRDGVCRVAEVKTERGTIIRSLQRLYPLELDAGSETSDRLREKGVVTRSGRRVKVPQRF